MRKFNSKNLNKILNSEMSEKAIIDILVYNKRHISLPTFDDWFDDHEKLIIDCSTKIDWSRYGNKSNYKNFKFFLSTEIGDDEELRNIDGKGGIPIIQGHKSMTLGFHKRMRSKAIIGLNLDNIQIFFWGILFELICNKNYQFSREKVETLAKLCVYTTIYHELFHHYINVQSYLSQHYRYNFEIDEALAVAFSRILIGYESNNHSYTSEFLDYRFKYTNRGYKDWVNYKSEEQFKLKLWEYLNYSFEIFDMGLKMTPILESSIYAIIENPNIKFEINF